MPDLKRALEKAIRERDLSTIRRMLEKQSPQDIANLLDRLETQDQVNCLPSSTAEYIGDCVRISEHGCPGSIAEGNGPSGCRCALK
jgi:Mg/Co/Ni transporter MgtE